MSLYDKQKLIEDVDVALLLNYAGIEHRRSGQTIYIRCPDHDHIEKIIDNCQILGKGYLCHSCGGRGDVFSLIMKSLNVDFKTAANMVVECCDGFKDDYFLTKTSAKFKRSIPFLSKEQLTLLDLHNGPVEVDFRTEIDNVPEEKYSRVLEMEENEDFYVLKKCVIPNPLMELYKHNFAEYKRMIADKAKERISLYEEMLSESMKYTSSELVEVIKSIIDELKEIVIIHSGTLEPEKRNMFMHLL